MTTIHVSELNSLVEPVLERLSGQLRVRTSELSMRSLPPRPELMAKTIGVELHLSMSTSSQSARQRAPQPLIASFVSYTATATTLPEDADEWEPEEAWSVQVTVHGQWDLSTIEGLTDDQARAFTITSSVMALHPFARQQIQSSLLAMNWPGYAIDIVRHPEAIVADEDGNIELDGIALIEQH